MLMTATRSVLPTPKIKFSWYRQSSGVTVTDVSGHTWFGPSPQSGTILEKRKSNK